MNSFHSMPVGGRMPGVGGQAPTPTSTYTPSGDANNSATTQPPPAASQPYQNGSGAVPNVSAVPPPSQYSGGGAMAVQPMYQPSPQQPLL
jgi:hypothetical protein